MVGLVLFAATAACGGAEQQRADYCATLAKNQVRLSDVLAGDDPAALLDNLPLLGDIAAQAPPDLTDEWQRFLNALRGLDDALDAAGVAPDDFAGGRPPAGLSAEQQGSIADAAEALADPGVLSAANGIEQQARDVCKLQLGM